MNFKISNYPTVELDKVCQIKSGGTPSRNNSSFFKGDIPWVKISDIENAENKIIHKTVEKISKAGLEDINNRLFEEGTLLFAMYGSVGKTAFISKKMSTNQAILGINSKGEINLEYLNYWFIKNKIKLLDSARGVALKNLNASIIKSTKIPLPPLETQKEIAHLLDAADALRQKTQEQLDHLDALAQSIFLEMFGDPVLNEKGWEVAKIKDLLVDGPTNGIYKHSSKYGKGVDIIRIDSFFNNYINLSKLKQVDISEKEEIRYKVNNGDILINRVNSRSHLGKIGLVKNLKRKAVYESNMMKMTFNKTLCLDEYLLKILSHPYVKTQILVACKDAVNQSSINQKDVNNLVIPVPDIDTQGKFNFIIQNIETQKIKLKQSLKESEDLFKCLLQDVFG